MLDLPAVGRELRTRRRALRIPSAELARRIGVSQTYVWLIEQAKPRQSGEPSRPNEDLLRRWTVALGMSPSEAQRIREMAGYFGPDFPTDRETMSIAPAPTSIRSASNGYDAPTEMGQQLGQGRQDFGAGKTANKAALHQWAGAGEAEFGNEPIAQRLHDILESADQSGRSDQVEQLLNSFFSWLEFHVGRDE